MDFTSWSPSHLIIAGLAIATIIGQTIAILARLKATTERLEKQVEKQGETFYHATERLEERMDKRFVEVINTMNQQLTETQKRIDDTNQQITGLRTEMNQRFVQVHSEINHVRDELSKLNQNHIDHLTHHESR